MRAAGLNPVRRTQLATTPDPVTHLILDTIGELANVYAVAAIAFVGNSFSPVNKGGGQNLLQPLAHGKPVLFGPLTATIRSEVALAKEAGVGFEVADSAALAQQGLRLLQDTDLRCEIERKAVALISANRGVSARYAEAVVEMADHAGRQPLPESGR
jgi:3-deoxy-D-manno-octulosonic-acid transferase